MELEEGIASSASVAGRGASGAKFVSGLLLRSWWKGEWGMCRGYNASYKQNMDDCMPISHRLFIQSFLQDLFEVSPHVIGILSISIVFCFSILDPALGILLVQKQIRSHIWQTNSWRSLLISQRLCVKVESGFVSHPYMQRNVDRTKHLCHCLICITQAAYALSPAISLGRRGGRGYKLQLDLFNKKAHEQRPLAGWQFPVSGVSVALLEKLYDRVFPSPLLP